jgi:hypothetical protein
MTKSLPTVGHPLDAWPVPVPCSVLLEYKGLRIDQRDIEGLLTLSPTIHRLFDSLFKLEVNLTKGRTPRPVYTREG